MKVFIDTIFLVTLLVVLPNISLSQWCTRLGVRTYQVGSKDTTITRMEKFCCDDYFLNGTNCSPFCEHGCPNGVCQEPHKCICNPGYALQPTKICEPVCTVDCGFGKCIKPETCECNEGYKYNQDRKTCEPVCTEPCPADSTCMEPDVCVCNTGFKPNFNVIGAQLKCEPICQHGCSNGTCIAPDVCQCFKGFSMNTTSHACHENICDAPCPLHAYCSENGGTCVCDEGYIKSMFLLQPPLHCEERLLHTLKLLAIFLASVAIFAIIIVIIVKCMSKKVSYEPQRTEEKFKAQNNAI